MKNFFVRLWNALVSRHGQSAISKATDLGIGIVSMLENEPNLTGSQKRDKAIAMLVGVLKSYGIELGTDALNMIVEAALQHVRNVPSVVPATPATKTPDSSATK